MNEAPLQPNKNREKASSRNLSLLEQRKEAKSKSFKDALINAKGKMGSMMMMWKT